MSLAPKAKKQKIYGTGEIMSSASSDFQRFVDWNVDILKRLLKQIEAKRKELGVTPWEGGKEPTLEKPDGKKVVVEEVAEVLEFDRSSDMYSFAAAGKSVTLDPEVESQLREFVTAIASSYRNHPFHCLQHASHVTMTVTKLISRIAVSDDLRKDLTEGSAAVAAAAPPATAPTEPASNSSFGITGDPLSQFSVVLAALVHALEHRGIPNEFLHKEEPGAAKYYKNRSMTEQRSFDCAWNKLMEPPFADLRKCIYANEKDLRLFRQVLINGVLAVDMHDEILQDLRNRRWEKTFRRFSDMTGLAVHHLMEGEDPSSSIKDPYAVGDVADENLKATIVLVSFMQSAYVFHFMKHFEVYDKWNTRLFTERYLAFKAGRIPDDPTATWYRHQLEYFDNTVIPLAMQLKDIDAFVVHSNEYLDFALRNRQKWALVGREMVARMAKEAEATAAAVLPPGAIVSEAGNGKSPETAPHLDKSSVIPKAVQRLVDWNAEALTRVLHELVAHRVKLGKPGTTPTPPEYKPKGGHPIDEVVEAISFPKAAAKKETDTSAADAKKPGNSVSRAAISQLHALVAELATQFKGNAFHCLEHGSHVSLTSHKLLCRIIKPAASDSEGADMHEKTFGLSSDPLAHFALVFGALIHDVDHQGVPNSQLVKEKTELAVKYKNRSIAEQNAIDLAWGLLMQRGFEDLRGCIFTDEEELLRFRQVLVNAVLAIDRSDEEIRSMRKKRWESAFKGDDASKADPNLKATAVIDLLMQASHGFHNLQHVQMYKRWNDRYLQECTKAFEDGRLESDPRETFPKDVVTFLDEEVLPLANQMKECGVFGASADEALKFAQINREGWANGQQQALGKDDVAAGA